MIFCSRIHWDERINSFDGNFRHYFIIRPHFQFVVQATERMQTEEPNCSMATYNSFFHAFALLCVNMHFNFAFIPVRIHFASLCVLIQREKKKEKSMHKIRSFGVSLCDVVVVAVFFFVVFRHEQLYGHWLTVCAIVYCISQCFTIGPSICFALALAYNYDLIFYNMQFIIHV